MKHALNILLIAAISLGIWVLAYLYFPVSIFDKLTLGSTITTIQGTDTLSASRTVINTNFSNLNTDKLQSGDSATALTIINASTTRLSCLGNCAFGSTATSSFATDGSLTLAGSLTVSGSPLAVTSGGTGWAKLNANTILLGNDTTRIATTSVLDLTLGGTGWAKLNAGYLLIGNDTTRIATSSNLYYDLTNSRLGIASTSPAYGLSLGSQKAIGITEFAVSTSSSITIDARNGNQQLVQMGGAAMTIGFSNFGVGTTIRLLVCNPSGSSAGAITWTSVHYFGGAAPTQTTTANQCDLYVVSTTQATSTSATTPILWISQGGAGLQ